MAAVLVPFLRASVLDGAAGLSGIPAACLLPRPLTETVKVAQLRNSTRVPAEGRTCAGCWSASAGLGMQSTLRLESRLPVLPSLSTASRLIWSLGSFGKLAIRAILWGYVSVSLVSLQINSKGRGQAGIFHSTAAPPRRPGPWFWMAPAVLATLFL